MVDSRLRWLEVYRDQDAALRFNDARKRAETEKIAIMVECKIFWYGALILQHKELIANLIDLRRN